MNMEVRLGALGFVMVFAVKTDGTIRDLTTYDTNYLCIKGQANRALTTVSASLGTTRWTTVAGDWTGTNFTKPGVYDAYLLLTDAATPTTSVPSDPFKVIIKGPFEA